MSDGQNTSQNQIPEENSSPASMEDPTELIESGGFSDPERPVSENEAHSEPADVPPGAMEASPEDFEVKSVDIPLSNSINIEPKNEPETGENQAENEIAVEPEIKPVSESEQELNVDQPLTEIPEIPSAEPETKIESETQTAQIPVFKPFGSGGSESAEKIEQVKPEPVLTEVKSESVFVKNEAPIVTTETVSLPNQDSPKIFTPVIPAVVIPTKNKARELWNKALSAIKRRKVKKLERIMSLYGKQKSITNDEVEKLLHVSDATVTRYFSQLESEGKIKQTGKTGKGVSYSKI